MKSESKYVQKKAVLACIRVLYKNPDFADSMESHIHGMLDE